MELFDYHVYSSLYDDIDSIGVDAPEYAPVQLPSDLERLAIGIGRQLSQMSDEFESENVQLPSDQERLAIGIGRQLRQLADEFESENVQLPSDPERTAFKIGQRIRQWQNEFYSPELVRETSLRLRQMADEFESAHIDATRSRSNSANVQLPSSLERLALEISRRIRQLLSDEFISAQLVHETSLLLRQMQDWLRMQGGAANLPLNELDVQLPSDLERLAIGIGRELRRISDEFESVHIDATRSRNNSANAYRTYKASLLHLCSLADSMPTKELSLGLELMGLIALSVD